jgi:transposase
MPLSDATKTKRKKLSEHQLGEISGLIKGKRHTLKQISDILGINYSTVKTASERYKKNGDTRPQGVRTGRPLKKSDRNIRCK